MFVLAYPYALFILVLPWLVSKLPKAKPINASALTVPFFQQLLAIELQLKPNTPSLLKKVLLWSIWILLCLSLAKPRWVDAPIAVPQQGRDIILAIDVSGSMETPDMVLHGKAVDRLSVVKDVANQFVDARIGDRLGLILFGSKAYLQTPLTFDQATVKNMIDDSTIKLAGPLTAIGDAIGLAIKRFSKIKSSSKVLVLLSDGTNNAGVTEPLKAAKLASERQVKIYTIGLGASSLQVAGFFGSQEVNPSTDLDEKTLQAIAKQTGGKFFRAYNSDDLAKVYATINDLEPNTKKAGIYRPQYDLFHWPLTAAVLLTLVLLTINLNRRTG